LVHLFCWRTPLLSGPKHPLLLCRMLQFYCHDVLQNAIQSVLRIFMPGTRAFNPISYSSAYSCYKGYFQVFSSKSPRPASASAYSVLLATSAEPIDRSISYISHNYGILNPFSKRNEQNLTVSNIACKPVSFEQPP